MLALNSTLRELDVSGNAEYSSSKGGPSFAQALSVGITDNGALSILDTSNNSMFGESDKTGITAWADVLKASTSITELNLAKNCIDAADATILAPAISDNGALSTITVHKFPLPIQNIKTKAELDLSGKELNYLDAIIIAVLLPLNVSGTVFDSPYYR